MSKITLEHSGGKWWWHAQPEGSSRAATGSTASAREAFDAADASIRRHGMVEELTEAPPAHEERTIPRRGRPPLRR